jgi:pantetheine-phosphate adenylyltransferase
LKAIYPGSFDPITSGHLDIIERATNVFGTVVVAIAVNMEKKPLFSVEERVELLREACRHLDNVAVDCFEGLTVDYARRQGAQVLIRSLRAVSDFEYELQMALMNKRLNENIETLFMMTSAEYSFLSSSLVKQLVELGAPITGLVPKCVEEKLLEKLKAKQHGRHTPPDK